MYSRAIWAKSAVEDTELIHKCMGNSLVKESPEMHRIRAAVKKAGIFAVLGLSERDGASLYITQSVIHTTGASSTIVARSRLRTSKAPSGETVKLIL
jgi:nitrilase